MGTRLGDRTNVPKAACRVKYSKSLERVEAVYRFAQKRLDELGVELQDVELIAVRVTQQF